MQRCLLLLLATSVAARAGAERAADLDAYAFDTASAPYTQPTWDRRDESGSQVHALLERAARLHQSGELDKAVQALKAVIKQDASNGEAYASLGKCLSDQGKHDLADKALAKATRLNNELLAQWSLF